MFDWIPTVENLESYENGLSCVVNSVNASTVQYAEDSWLPGFRCPLTFQQP